MRGIQQKLLGGLLAFSSGLSLAAANSQLVSWNNLGMHCMDSDYSVFSILPPYNTVEAQLIVNGKLIRDGAGYKITYQAVADPDGSLNSTAMGKGNFYAYVGKLYGATLAPETGLAGWAMPGVTNLPQTMLFETTNRPTATAATLVNWWRAEGIPISPYDDGQRKNPYPLMRLIAWDSANRPLATNDVVLPVSDEMDCRACHASGAQTAAQPTAGWVWDGSPERDYRLNILRLHDEWQFANQPRLYAAALAAGGFNAQGLYRGVVADDRPVLCARCHASEALGAQSFEKIPPLTVSVHSFHAHVLDPDLQVTLDEAADRGACYRCHPGATTRCLRGAMGHAVAQDGSMQLQCQSCHGSLSAVGASDRIGWLMEPNCQSCHTGTATHNNGQIRYASVFQTNGAPRLPVDGTFATQADTPAPGLSLYRFSAGHGGLQCAACHGSTHAEFPSAERNDNLRNIALQGHEGVLSECGACHPTTPNTVSGGPHGLHPLGQTWVNRHADVVESTGRTQCATCHGNDYRGTVLSRTQAERTLSARLSNGRSVTLVRGAVVGCYTCHNGPSGEGANPAATPSVNNIAINTAAGQPGAAAITVDPSSATLSILSQPGHGTVGVSNNVVTYYPEPGYVGADSFTYDAWNAGKNSLLGTGTITVTPGMYSLATQARVPASYPAAWPVPFAVTVTRSNTTAAIEVAWSFGDGSASDTNLVATHAYAAPGSYPWMVTAAIGNVRVQKFGTLLVEPPIVLAAGNSYGQVQLSWPKTTADCWLESSPALGHPIRWTAVTNRVEVGERGFSIALPVSGDQFYRLKRSW